MRPDDIGMFEEARPGLLGALDRFEIIDVIGSGGMGIVLLARDPATDVKVAIKLLRPELLREPRHLKRFLTEARHMYRLDHPNQHNNYNHQRSNPDN